MTDWKKTTDDFAKFLNDTGTQFAKIVTDASSSFTEGAKKAKQKLELKSQIGDHTRALNKAYARLGEAYYDAYTSHREVQDMDDVLALIKSNRKVIELLNEKLSSIEAKEAAEEKAEAADNAQKDAAVDAEEKKDDGAEIKVEEEKKDDNGPKEIHID